MSLTFSQGPLSDRPSETNYAIEGPAHRLFFDAFPRRVRAVFAGITVFDTRRGRMLHETGLLPQLYVRREDVRLELLEKSGRTSHCPYKGEAAYWSIRVGDRLADQAAWAYPAPGEAAPWLREHVAFNWERMDAWFDEDEEVQGHLRDPYHRVDVRESSVHVRVAVAGKTIAETDRPGILSETGLPNRYYIAPEDVRGEFLRQSAKHTVCPYKGTASYKTLAIGERRIEDAAWFYPQPLESAAKVRGWLCFLHEEIALAVDGKETK
jgi:uncharacterized protein (DUF427 family)